jgi:hypothetical protein
MYPGDPNGQPQEVINCRCTMIVYFEEFASSEDDIARSQAQIAALMAEEEERTTQ